MSNVSVLKAGLERARAQLFRELEKRLQRVGEMMLRIAVARKEWTGFTGNAQTSLAIGIYRSGKLTSYATGLAFQDDPLMKKIRLNKWVYLKSPYEGRARTVRGKVEVTDETGPRASIRFLKLHRPRANAELALVMTIGVEYWEFLSKDGELGPLVTAAESAEMLIDRVIPRGGIKIT